MVPHTRHVSRREICRAFVPLALWIPLLLTSAISQSQNPTLERLLNKGQAALDADDFPAAVSAFEEAEQLAPENLAANRGLLVSYLQSGRLTDALDLGKKAVA